MKNIRVFSTGNLTVEKRAKNNKIIENYDDMVMSTIYNMSTTVRQSYCNNCGALFNSYMDCEEKMFHHEVDENGVPYYNKCYLCDHKVADELITLHDLRKNKFDFILAD